LKGKLPINTLLIGSSITSLTGVVFISIVVVVIFFCLCEKEKNKKNQEPEIYEKTAA
jgi:uncharacterized membrane protein YhaH (DUF805 family)